MYFRPIWFMDSVLFKVLGYGNVFLGHISISSFMFDISISKHTLWKEMRRRKKEGGKEE
jgi:hypothetical protein